MKIPISKKSSLPDKAGVYFFYENKKLLYIGKATSLRQRVQSYFSKDILETRGPKIKAMIEKANFIDYQITSSVLEALILEASLIKKHQPPYNTREKDDKSYYYLAITDEPWPKVMIVRGRDLEKTSFTQKVKLDEVFGPFPNGKTLREALKILRKVFPFRDQRSTVPAYDYFYQLLKLAPRVGEGRAQEHYRSNIEHLKQFLKGNKKSLIKDLKAKMNSLADNQLFEEAGQVRNQIFALEHIQDVALLTDEIKYTPEKTTRIEAYDVAHLSGTSTIGVMVVVTNGNIDQGQYRQFKVKQSITGSDTDALAETFSRRLKHREWRLPDLIVADGGIAQKRVLERLLREHDYQIPVVAVTKNEQHKPVAIQGRQSLVKQFKKDILLANHEAHRFAVRLHRLLRQKNFIQKSKSKNKPFK